MRALALLLVAGCGSSQPTLDQPAAPPVPTNEPVAVERPATCADAAFGIEATSKDLRPADQEIVPLVRTKCLVESWSAAAIACFAKLRASDDLLSCVDELTVETRTSLLVDIQGTSASEADQTAELANVKQRLTTISVGITTCDQFVKEVARVMDCTRLTLNDRILLGSETAEAWSLSTARLTIQDRVRMSGVCGRSLDDLHKHATQQSC